MRHAILRALRGASSDRALLANLYPDPDRLTDTLLPRLVSTPGYGYVALVRTGSPSHAEP